MKIYTFQNEIPNYINEQLLEFEKCFTYPLDSKYSFRISHAPVYIDFFQSIGSSKFILAMEDHKIIGICVAIQKENAHYICDLKIHPQVKDKRLCYKIQKQLRNMNSNSNLYAVYMEGTKNVQRFVHKQRIQNPNIQTK